MQTPRKMKRPVNRQLDNPDLGIRKVIPEARGDVGNHLHPIKRFLAPHSQSSRPCWQG